MIAELVVPGATAAFGAWLVYEQGGAVWRGEASRRWPRVRGQIRRVAMEGSSVSAGRGARVAIATPVVRYVFWVEGEKYEGSRVNWTGFSANAAIAARSRYEELRDVWVYFDPRDPQRAVLEPGASTGAWGRAALGMGVLILGISLLLPV